VDFFGKIVGTRSLPPKSGEERGAAAPVQRWCMSTVYSPVDTRWHATKLCSSAARRRSSSCHYAGRRLFTGERRLAVKHWRRPAWH